MRINHQGQYRLPSETDFMPLNQLITEVGQGWAGKVNCFKTHSLDCTLLARWDEGRARALVNFDRFGSEEGQHLLVCNA